MNPAGFPEQVRRAWAIAKKDIRIYYIKGPVLIFGIFMPVFLFLGRLHAEKGARTLIDACALAGARGATRQPPRVLETRQRAAGTARWCGGWTTWQRGRSWLT